MCVSPITNLTEVKKDFDSDFKRKNFKVGKLVFSGVGISNI